MAVTQAYYKDENRDVGNETVIAGVNASAGNEAEVSIDRTQLDVNKRETNILGQAVESNEEPAHVKAARLAQEAKRRAERNVFNKTEERHQQHKCMRRFASCCPCLKNWLLGKELVEGKTPLMRTMQAFEMTKRDSAKFLKLFEKIDWDHSGTIDIEELFGYLKMDVAGYARKTFSTMNVQHEYMDEDGRFDPRKFAAVWQFIRELGYRVDGVGRLKRDFPTGFKPRRRPDRPEARPRSAPRGAASSRPRRSSSTMPRSSSGSLTFVR